MSHLSEFDGYFYRAQNYPVSWCKDYLGSTLWSAQKDIIKSVRDNRRTSVTACHAIGKTYITANIAVWFLMAFPDSVVLLSAPTYRQVKELLWREISKLFENAKQRGCPLGGKFFSEPKWEIGEKWFMLGFSPQHPEKAQGFHAPYILVILDEASGVSSGVHQAMRGIMASGHVRLLMLGNPNRPEGEFHASFTSSRHMYQTFQVSAWDTPNLKDLRDQCGVNADGTVDPAFPVSRRLEILRAAPLVHDKLVNPEYVADMEEEFGWDSDVYRVRVLGKFPSGAPDQLISLDQVMQATYRWEDLEDSQRWWLDRQRFSGQVIGGLDVARFGSGESVWCSRLDTVAAPLATWNGLNAPDLAGRVADQCRSQMVSLARVDADGYGGGPYDLLCSQVPGVVEFRGGSTEGVNLERFANRRASDYWGLRERYFECRIAHQADDKLIGQLTAVRFKYRPSGQILIESKDEMIKRGVKSPDRADAVMMCFGGRDSLPQMQLGGSTTNWSGMYGRT